MKCLLPLILFIAVGLCESNRLMRQIFDSSKRSLQQYCFNFNGILPGICYSGINSTIESPQVNQLKIGGCDPKIVLDSVKRFQQNLRVLDISFSGYKNFESFDLTFDQLQIFNASHNELSFFVVEFFLRISKHC